MIKELGLKKFQSDANGIYILSKIQIENIAEDFLKILAPKSLKNILPTPMGQIIWKLKKNYKLDFIFSKDLDQTDDGRKIFGEYRNKPPKIFLDKSFKIVERTGWKFIIAHEIGHYILHSNIKNRENIIKDTRDNLLKVNHQANKNEFDWIEWQANKFASALLLPKKTFLFSIDKLIASDIGYGYPHDYLFVDGQPCNLKTYWDIIAVLRSTFDLSEKIIRFRLIDLGKLKDERLYKKNTQDVLYNLMVKLFK
ncbi:MAG: ImmA/IrrE family metallo-endopeptidase [Candidatus Cloacimonetes bacterium]|nr:ImmA/IrrE family metallo-endopeptidase [Candidatus Cloacimonadota bacterium]